MTDNIATKFKSSKAVGAMLGAAYGDALGWPNERIGKSKAPKQPQGRLHEFRRWTRRSGSRYAPYEEIINAGEYSDDTQFILCLSRSLLKGKKWFEFYTQVEQPFWSLYERGGGGATKSAVGSWLDGTEPWNPNREPKDVRKYFDAGGNGVAMRALPHALYLSETDFSEVATSIFLDGITTHGHPIALLGALVYGFALWSALRKETVLGYGELIDELIANESVWASIPVHDKIGPVWMSQAEKYLNDYQKVWSEAKDEILKYLEISKSEISKGALSCDGKVFENIQCFNKQIGGAGTVAAVASVYLASRYAANPINGVIKAAFAIGADTDTIASMAGGLLGCIQGSDWLSSVKSGIQDFNYIEKTALKLSGHKTDEFSDFKVLKRTAIKKWTDDAVSAPDSSEVKFPDGRIATVKCSQDQIIGRNGKKKVVFRRFITSDEQTIYINKIEKNDLIRQQKTLEAALTKQIVPNQMQEDQQIDTLNLGPKLLVASIKKSASFYKDVLGLTIKKQLKDTVVFNRGLVLVPESYSKEFQNQGFKSMLYVEVTDIQNRYKRVKEQDIQLVTSIEYWGQSNRHFFRCLDFDGNMIEVFEKQ